jgi:hypothetical protein
MEFKTLLDNLRISNTKQIVIPIQKIIRGFIARQKFYTMIGKERAQADIIRKKEAYERELMNYEDDLSTSIENAIRDSLREILILKKLLRDVKEEKIRFKLNSCAILIQKILRGFVIRKYGKFYMCKVYYDRAFDSRNEDDIKYAIYFPSKLNIRSNKLITQFEMKAKELLLLVMHESYINNELYDAITAASEELLMNAITMAEESRMYYLSGMSHCPYPPFPFYHVTLHNCFPSKLLPFHPHIVMTVTFAHIMFCHQTNSVLLFVLKVTMTRSRCSKR